MNGGESVLNVIHKALIIIAITKMPSSQLSMAFSLKN